MIEQDKRLEVIAEQIKCPRCGTTRKRCEIRRGDSVAWGIHAERIEAANRNFGDGAA